MSGEFEAIGDVATGALVANAVEPGAGVGGAADEAHCQNCGAPLSTAFCGQCGQKAKVHRTLSAFWHDLVHSVFHFDGKIWRTIPMLAFKPGHLTRRYIHGERAKFVSPLALFLFCVFLMFAAFNFVGGPAIDTKMAQTTAGLKTSLATKRQSYDAEMREDLADLTQAKAKGESVKTIEDSIKANTAEWKAEEASAMAEIANRERLERGVSQVAQSARDEIAKTEQAIAAARKAGLPVDQLKVELADKKMAQEIAEAGKTLLIDQAAPAGFDVNVGSGAMNNALVKQARENPKLLAFKVQSNAYKFSWALILLSTPFVWLLFPFRREHKLFDHAVFATYSICFMMALLSISILTIHLTGWEVVPGLAMAIWPPIHMYKQLRYGYGLRRRSTLWRTLLLMFFALFALTMFAWLIVALGAN